MVDFCKVRILSRNRQHFTVFYRVASKISPKHLNRFLFREIRGEREKRVFGRCTQSSLLFITHNSPFNNGTQMTPMRQIFEL